MLLYCDGLIRGGGGVSSSSPHSTYEWTCIRSILLVFGIGRMEEKDGIKCK